MSIYPSKSQNNPVCAVCAVCAVLSGIMTGIPREILAEPTYMGGSRDFGVVAKRASKSLAGGAVRMHMKIARAVTYL